MNVEKAQKHLNKVIHDWEEKPQLNFEMAVILKYDQKKIGRSRIHLDYENDTAIIGWLLLKKDWGKGYATEMTRALIDYSFDVLNVHRVCALCHPENIGSWRVLEKCNMRREAHFIQKCKYIKDGNIIWEDELEYAMLESER
ncbi:GNAT family N-acetyltransferase [Lacrimispora sp.]|uniref:GNAT family N-acetyltransferase n=1 Tax=Lacrimispora sp. TaxID=2719234 RepID=UPI0034604AB0